MEVFPLVPLALAVHVTFLFSIFDIYFKSPLVSSIEAVRNHVPGPGKRVVLISVDGLRADSLFGGNPATEGDVTEFLREVVARRGTWGVSRSRVPTESRPGHVALLAGFYEDPSAVTRGWKENPVDFDSIFNRTRCSFAWGSPDILNIFFKGLRHGCAFMNSYRNEQDFAGDTKQYDNWVYEKLEEFLRTSKGSNALRVHENGVFYFLHLLGQDTSGHADKPHSQNYLNNLKNVDSIVQKVDNLFREIYGDEKTTFVLTSDHGMTDWGSHGAGEPDETDTPIVAWGAGIKRPAVPGRSVTINQADVAPLLAVLLGVPIPVNSVGVLPLEFLDMSRREVAEVASLNAKQMVAQFAEARRQNERHVPAWLRSPFPDLSSEGVALKVAAVEEALRDGRFADAVDQSRTLVNVCLKGLTYYQNYYQRPLLCALSLSYVAWIAYLVLVLVEEGRPMQVPSFRGSGWLALSKAALLSAAFAVSTFILVQKLPWSFHCYALLPLVLWHRVLEKGRRSIASWRSVGVKKLLGLFTGIGSAVELLVSSFFRRWSLCLSLGVVLLWSLSSGRSLKAPTALRATWLCSGAALGLFPLLPTVGSRPRPLLVATAGLLLVCLLAAASARPNRLRPRRLSLAGVLLFCALAAATLNSYSVHVSFEASRRVPDANRYLSWLLFLFSCSLLSCSRADSDLVERLTRVFGALATPFVLLSVTHEVFFLTILFVHLYAWIFMEESAMCGDSNLSHLRIAYVFLTYIFLSFFGLGNVSSLNSFDPAWVRCFLTVFSPFSMTFLILLKTVIPFFVVSCAMRTVTVAANVNPVKLFVVVLIYSNVMALNFLFLVRNEGSWLDIGVSISHYVIQQVTIVFLLVLYAMARHVMVPRGKDSLKVCALPMFYGSLKSH